MAKLHELQAEPRTEPTGDYVDVRGSIPTYVRGVLAVQLHGAKRSITVSEARDLVSRLQ
jgi:hypothetical protein